MRVGVFPPLFLSWSCLPHICLTFLFHPSSFISHQQSLTTHQCLRCQFLIYSRKMCNYHFFTVRFSSVVCLCRAALHKMTCWRHSSQSSCSDFCLGQIYCIIECNPVLFFLNIGCGCMLFDGWPVMFTVPAASCIFSCCGFIWFNCGCCAGTRAVRCTRSQSVSMWLIPLCMTPCHSVSTLAVVRDTPAGKHSKPHTAIKTCSVTTSTFLQPHSTLGWIYHGINL